MPTFQDVAIIGGRLAIIAGCAAGSLNALQLPAGPPKSVHGCLRPDEEKTAALVRQAVAKGQSAEDVLEVQKQVEGCVNYTVTLQSSMRVVFHGPGGGTATISGKGSITFGLAPDQGDPDFALTSGPSDLTAPVYWSDAVITRGNKCVVTIVPASYTPYTFWLGVQFPPDLDAKVQITPSGEELHSIETKCPNPVGVGSVTIPAKESIFSPLWISLHGMTVGAAMPTPGALDPAKMQAMAAQSPLANMDMKKLEAMAKQLPNKPTSSMSPADMMKLVKEVAPNAEQLAETARNNFTFKSPGDCAPSGAYSARCTISRTVTVPDNKGSTQTVTESTVITIAKTP